MNLSWTQLLHHDPLDVMKALALCGHRVSLRFDPANGDKPKGWTLAVNSVIEAEFAANPEEAIRIFMDSLFDYDRLSVKEPE